MRNFALGTVFGSFVLYLIINLLLIFTSLNMRGCVDRFQIGEADIMTTQNCVVKWINVERRVNNFLLFPVKKVTGR